MGYCLWEPRRIKNMEQDCQRLQKAKGKIVPMKVMMIRAKRRHLITDYSHRMPKLHCPWDDDAKKKHNEISPELLYHGLHSTDVTERLKIRPPKHSAHPALADQADEYHGRQAADVTEMYTFASRGKKPPSRDHYYGREATDISEFLRIIPPVAKEGDESNEFFGRPKSDVTDYNLLPLRTIDANSRSEEMRPLGRCPPGPMCDYVPLIRDKEGMLIRPQPERPPSPLCTSGTHEWPVPTTLVRRHQQENEQHFQPGAGGILAQIVPGFSRSEAKKPVGKGVPGVMADYVQLVRDETGRVMNTPPRQPSPQRDPCAAAGCEDCNINPKSEEVQYANRDERKRPLGKVPVGVMRDFVPNPTRGKHKHTTQGYWALPAAYPATPPDSVNPEKCPGGGDGKRSEGGDGQLSPRPTDQRGAAQKAVDTLKDVKKKLKKDRRRNKVCEMHEAACPFAAEQGHVGSCISHPAVSSYVKWPEDGDLELGPCKKHGGRTGIFSVRGSPCSAAASGAVSPTRSTTSARGPSGNSCNASTVDGASTSGSRPRSPFGDNSRTESLANQSPLNPDTACPRVSCQCIQVVNKGTGPPAFGYAESISRLDPKYPKKTPGTGISGVPKDPSSAKLRSKSSRQWPPKRSMAFVTEETSPQHFQVPYFGLAQTYVTNPEVSPNLTPPIRRARNPSTDELGRENVPGKRDGFEETKSCTQADICKHHQDGKTSWFGRSKTYVTDPAVSPNLTPPCFQTKFR